MTPVKELVWGSQRSSVAPPASFSDPVFGALRSFILDVRSLVGRLS